MVTIFKLSAEGLVYLAANDGTQTLRAITLSLADRYHIFAPDVVTALTLKLAKAVLSLRLNLIRRFINQLIHAGLNILCGYVIFLMHV